MTKLAERKRLARLLQVDLTVRSLFDRNVSASGIVISIPVPPQTAQVSIKRSKGQATYDGALGAIRWTIAKFGGQKEHSLSADIVLVSTTREKRIWSRCALATSRVGPTRLPALHCLPLAALNCC